MVAPSIRLLVDLLEVQIPLFGVAASSAAARATPEDRRCLRRCADALAAVPGDDLDGRGQAVFAMFDALRDASRNPELVAVLHAERVAGHRLLTSREGRADLAALRPHYLARYTADEIVAAVCAHDVDGARRAAERVFGAVRDVIATRAHVR